MEKTLLVQEYKQLNPSFAIQALCLSFELARSSFYAGVKAVRRNNRLDKIVWDKIVEIWETFPGMGYRKLGPRLRCSGKKILRIIRKYRNPSQSKLIKKPVLPRRIPNVIKKITMELKENKVLLERGNWVLREGKNKYRHVIDPTRPYQL